MKRKVLKAPLAVIFLIGLIFSCQKENPDKQDDMSLNIMEARNWFESIYHHELAFESKGLVDDKIKAKPDWNLAIESKLDDSKTVEVPLILQKEFGYATEESFQSFKETGDDRFIKTGTSLVIEKKGNKTHGFLMTIIPDKDYKIKNNFDAFSSSYKKWQKGFSGVVLYHELDGTFSNGWKLSGREVITNVIQVGRNKLPIELSKFCTDYYLHTITYTCSVITKGINSDCSVTSYTVEYLYSVCYEPSGGGSSSNSNNAGYLETSLPCDGDPILNMAIAPTSLNGNPLSGTYGCVRYSDSTICAINKKNHGGVDIACDPGTPIYSMRGGVVIDMENTIPPNSEGTNSSRGNLGNFVTVRYTNSSGSITDITYAHLNYVNVTEGSSVTNNQVIGLSGKTGNAVNVPNAHVHVQVFQDGIRTDPAGYFATLFSANGSVSSPCNPYF